MESGAPPRSKHSGKKIAADIPAEPGRVTTLGVEMPHSVSLVSTIGSSAIHDVRAHSQVEVIVKEFASIHGATMDRLVSAIRKNIDDLVRQRAVNGTPVRWCYVPMLPVGRVTGKCLSLDFGCNDNFFHVAVCNIRNEGDGANDKEEFRPIDRQAFVLTRAIRHAHMSTYCNFVAICVRKVLLDNGLLSLSGREPVYMGIVAGFDVRVKPQITPTVASVPLTFKDYKMRGFINSDFVASFQQAFDKLSLNVKVVTVLNDTVSTMLSGVHKVYAAKKDGPQVDCSIAVVSTRSGANACFLETDQDFLDSCTADRRLLLRSPRGFCVAVNPEVGMHAGQNGELSSFINTLDKKVLESDPEQKLRWECLSSGCWYFQLLRKSMTMLKALKVLHENFPDTALSSANCFEVFSVCDAYFSKGESSDRLASELKALLDPSGQSVIPILDAEVIARICRAIVIRTAAMLAACVVAIAQRIYGKAFPGRVVVAFSGAMFRLSQLEPALKTELVALFKQLNNVYTCTVDLVAVDIAFGCAVSAITTGKNLRLNAQLQS